MIKTALMAGVIGALAVLVPIFGSVYMGGFGLLWAVLVMPVLLVVIVCVAVRLEGR